MQIVIHRGTHQIGGAATEISTDKTRIIIDMGDELSMDNDFVPSPLSIPGVTDSNGRCDAVLCTHYHGDHIGQLKNLRDEIPVYMGALARDIILAVTSDDDKDLKQKISQAITFTPGKCITIGDISVTPYSIDHSACDSYMFLIQAEGKRILHTGDFRMHGLRGKGMHKILDKYIKKVDILITEGTALSRPDENPPTEHELQQKAAAYMDNFKYVFVLCASTNLERICALAKAVPQGKYFICDEYQRHLLDIVTSHWHDYSHLYHNIKVTEFGDNLLPRFRQRGFLMMVRDNRKFRKIIQYFDPDQSIILYSMWDGYRIRPGSTIPDFLSLAGHWQPLHTSGHASREDISLVIDKVNPEMIIPIHTDKPDMLESISPGNSIVILNDGNSLRI